MAFIANPYKFSRDILEEEKSGKLESTKTEVEQHLMGVHSDSQVKEPLGDCSRILEVEEPSIPLDMKEPTWREVNGFVKKARSCSALVQMVFLIRSIRNVQSS